MPIPGRSRRLGLLLTYFDSIEKVNLLHQPIHLARLVTAVQELDQLEASLYLLTTDVATSDSTQFLIRFAELTLPLVGAERIVVWLANKTTGRYEALNAPAQFRQPQHNLEERNAKELGNGQVLVPLYNLPWTDSSIPRLAAAIYTFEHLSGIIEFQFPRGAGATDSHIRSLATEVVKKCGRALEGIERYRKIDKLNTALSRVAQAETIDGLLTELNNGAIDITDCGIGSVLLLNKDTGRLEVAKCHPIIESSTQLSMDEGVTGRCLRTLRPINLADVGNHKYFITYWPGIRSELAIPLFLPNSSARVPNLDGTGTKLAMLQKRIGVLNVESPLSNAFSKFDLECLTQLAAAASVMYDRLNFGQVLRGLHDAESELAQYLAGGEDWLDVIKKVGEHIIDALAYTHLNISIVSIDGKRIKSEYIWWDRPDQDKAQFKKLSDHDILTSTDIQAYVVKNKQIEVPKDKDPRFHPEIHSLLGLEKLIRVYIPLMMGDVVVGTLEAGYRRKFMQHIFERDIQILKTLSDYAAAAIWKKRRGQLDILRHEIAAPRKAIMDDALFLQRHWNLLSPEKIIWKLEDIFLDGSTIEYLLDKIEYYITGRAKETKPEFCNVGATIITKTILQQNRFLRSLNLNLQRIKYSREELTKIRTVVDKVKAGEVFNNLIGNAIKYRKSNETLQIRVAVESLSDRFLILLSDDGIGVDHGYESQIFDEGVRAPTAVAIAQGSGLGLWLARQYMLDMGGDIRLENL